MPAIVLDVRNADDPRDLVHRAVQTLAEGRLVVFPTETIYGVAASALDADAVERLCQVKGRQAGHPMALAVKSADDALDYVPDMGPLGRRLARRCWPGPVTLVLPDRHPEGLARRLPASVREVIAPSGTIGLRVPAHDIILETLRLTTGPLVLTSANRSGEADPTSAQDAIDQLGEHVDLILGDGRSQFAQPSSVVHVDGSQYRSLRAGVVTEANLRRLASFMVLLVCTGNTCRSPMAEMLTRRRIADKLGCGIDELDSRGVIVASAGIAAMSGGGPSPEAVAAMSRRGLDLSQHQVQPLSQRLVQHADLILTMTRSHRLALLAQWPGAAGRTRLLAPGETDIADPIGGPAELYDQCAEQIAAGLKYHLEQIDLATAAD